MPAWREPEWGEPSGSRGSADFAASPVIPESGNPLLLVSTSDALVLLGRSFGLKMADIARALKISRETAYQALQRARTNLTPMAESKLARTEPRRSGRCVACGGPRPADRIRCGSCWESSEKKRVAGRTGARARWRKPTPARMSTEPRVRGGGDAGV